jgi:predicted deacetylase
METKIAIVTIHDVNPSCTERLEQVTDILEGQNISYNLSLVPFYQQKFNLINYPTFTNQLLSLSRKHNVEITLHGLYHEINTLIEDFESQSKEQEKSEIQIGLKIIETVKLPLPTTFIPPAWRLSRETIEALKSLNFKIVESRSSIEVIQAAKKYLLSPVMNWDKYGDKDKNREMLNENKIEFYKHLFNLDGESFGIFRLAIHPPHDPSEALEDQMKMIEHLKTNQDYKFITYSELADNASSDKTSNV